MIRPPGPGKCYFFLWGMATVGQREKILSVASPLPSLQVRKGSAVNEFLGWLIEKMAVDRQ